MTNYQVFKVIIFSGLLWICISATDQEQRKDTDKADFSFLEKDIKHEDWIDPFDMFEYKPSIGTHKTADQIDVKKSDESELRSTDKLHPHSGNPSETYKPEGSKSYSNKFASHQKYFDEYVKTEVKPCRDEEFIYLKRTANMVLNRLETLKRDSPSTILHVILTVTEDAVATLKAFLGSPCKHVQEFDSTIVEALNHAELTESYTYLDSVYNCVHQLFQSETTVFCIATSLAVIMSNRQLLRMSMKQTIFRLIIITFIISFAWNWVLLIKMETANAYAKTEILGPSDCHIDKMGTYKRMTLILGTIFFPSNDKCKEYYEAVLVEPVWKVSPLLALSKTFSELCFQPLGLLGHHLGHFFQNLFSAVSWYLLLPVSIIVTIIILLLLLLLFGYRIRLPFFFTIEPGHQPYTREQSQLISDVLEGRVHIQRINSQITSVNEPLGQCSNCSASSETHQAIELKLKETSNKEKGIQTDISELNSLYYYLTDGKINGKIQELDTVTKEISVGLMGDMHEEE